MLIVKDIFTENSRQPARRAPIRATRFRADAGFAILQVMIAFTLLSVLSLGTTQYFRFQQQQMKTNRTYSNKDILISQLSRYIVDNETLTTSANYKGGGASDKNPAFKACVLGGSTCTANVEQDLILVEPFGTVVAGPQAQPQYYDLGGQPCNTGPSPTCGIQAIASFHATCTGGAGTCPSARSVTVTFSVRQAPGVQLASKASIASSPPISSTSAIPLNQVSSGTAGQLPIWLTTTTLGDSVVTEAGQNHGVAMTNPVAMLHVAATPTTVNPVLLEASSAAGYPPRLALQDMSVASAPVWLVENTADSLRIHRQKDLFTQGVPGLSLLGSQPPGQTYLGIGTDYPTGLINLQSDMPTTEDANDVVLSAYNDYRYIPDYSFYRARGQSFATAKPLQMWDSVGTPLDAIGYSTNGWAGQGAAKWVSLSDLSSGPAKSKIYFATGPGNSVFTVYDGGNISVGNVIPTEHLHVLGNMRVEGSATDCILGNGSGSTNCTSDARLKDHIVPIDDALQKILQLHGVEFDWNALSGSPGKHAIGVIAQEVEKVFPALVQEDKTTGYKRVSYNGLVAPLIQATHELFGQCQESSRARAAEEKLSAELTNRIIAGDMKLAQLTEENAKIEAENASVESTLSRIEAQLAEVGK